MSLTSVVEKGNGFLKSWVRNGVGRLRKTWKFSYTYTRSVRAEPA